MAYKLLVSNDAHRDIDEIVNYIVHNLHSPKAARDLIQGIESGYLQLCDNPYLYGYCSDEYLRAKGYRKIVIKNYLVLYRINESEKIVYIVRIVYGSRDYANLL
jgi:addiction module RelE/StbE family toxin